MRTAWILIQNLAMFAMGGFDVKRRLSAILFYDVVGYSRSMHKNEAATIEAIKANRKAIIDQQAELHNGRTIQVLGDGGFMEFASAVDATRFAIAMQTAVAERNLVLPKEQRLVFRIGINIGDVGVDGDLIYGDGVNIASRLEGLAEPGGICIHRSVRNQVRGKLDLDFEDLGDVQVKETEPPVRVFNVILNDKASLIATRLAEAESISVHKSPMRKPRVRQIAAMVALVFAVLGALLWTQFRSPPVVIASIERMSFPLPDKPSIAVLPFTNMSGDPEQEYFSDGITEDLITDLSKISGLFVISRNSTFTYKGKPVKVREVAEELGVRYVLEGSVRRAGEQVRINAQLIDATTGGHVWAERYEGVMTDVFALQDEVTSKIISALAVRLTSSERQNLARMPTENLEAYDNFLRAERGLFSQNSKGLAAALSYYRTATEIDPTFARAWAGHARAAVDVWRFDWFNVMPGHIARKQAYESASRALSLDPNSARAHSVLAILQMVDGHHDEAIESAKRAVTLNPNEAGAHMNAALVLSYAGEHDEAVRTMMAALRLNPKPPSGFYRLSGFIQLMAHNYKEAVDLLIKARNTTPSDPSHEELAMAYAQLDRVDQAKAEVDGMLELWPAANLAYYRVLYAHHKREEDLDFRIDALGKAGLPQWPYGYNGRKENRLTGSELKRLLFDRSWFGHRVGAEEFNRENTKDGSVRFRDPKAHPGRSRSAYMLEGTASIDGDMLCYRYEEFLLGRRYCGYVYRNLEGSHKEKNAFVDVNAVVMDYLTVGP